MVTPDQAKVILVMGVSGCGKSSVAAELVSSLGGRLIEGDAFHPPENIARMAAGQSLDDAMRAPWLDRIAAEIATLQAVSDAPIVVACSALKRAYRNRLRATAPDMRILCLVGSMEMLRQRLETRQGHFIKAGLLASQLGTLEVPGPEEGATVIDIDQPVAAIVDRFLEETAGQRS
ncbi:Gluconokinase [Rhizobium sp. EC-SD404]|nr:Gluconokinase [Rhizobium sp. EC-SD404]